MSRSQDHPSYRAGKSGSGVETGVGWPHRHYALTDSTNARAKELAANGAPHGTVVTADEQTAGRGRQGRVWVAPPGRALLYSLLLRPLGDRPLLPLVVALAVCEAAEGLVASSGEVKSGGAMAPQGEAGKGAAPPRCLVKWPNDVLLEGRKLAGALIEARRAPQRPTSPLDRPGDGEVEEDWAVIGVGLNLTIEPEEFPPELRDRATSLAVATSLEPGETRSPGNGWRTRCTTLLSAALERWVDAEDEATLAAWSERDALEGRRVAWDGGSGIAGGVDGRGNLVVATPSGPVTLNAGEVHLR